MSKPAISREALDRKIAQIVKYVADHQNHLSQREKDRMRLAELQSQVSDLLDNFSANDTLEKIPSRGKLMQSLHSVHADAEAEIDRLESDNRQALSQTVSKAVNDYFQSIETFRKQGGEYFNGSVHYRPRDQAEAEKLDRILATLEELGHPIKVVSPAAKSASETYTYSPLNFVTSLEGVDAFEWHAKAEDLAIRGEHVTTKRLFLDFSGQMTMPEEREFHPGWDGHGGHVANAYERNAFVMGSGAPWQDPFDHNPKAGKFIMMAIAGSVEANRNKLFYMYGGTGRSLSPQDLAIQVEQARLERDIAGQTPSP